MIRKQLATVIQIAKIQKKRHMIFRNSSEENQNRMEEEIMMEKKIFCLTKITMIYKLKNKLRQV